MRYEVSFARPFTGGYDVAGKGAIRIDELALLIEGEFPRFTIPLVWTYLRSLFCIKSIRTIPYSRILAYKPSGGLVNRHRLRFRLANGQKRWIAFSIIGTGDRRAINAAFAQQIEEYRAIAGGRLGT